LRAKCWCGMCEFKLQTHEAQERQLAERGCLDLVPEPYDPCQGCDQCEHPNKSRRSNWRRTYGLTYERMLQLADFQFRLCGICKAPIEEDSCVVDHNPVTNEVRGLLCQADNHRIAFGGTNEREIAYLLRPPYRRMKATLESR